MSFILSYAYAKFALLWEVRSPRVAFLLYELRYSFANLLRSLGFAVAPQLYLGPNLIRTVNGDFRVRPGTHDAAIISPAFERRDRRHLMRKMRRSIRPGHSLYFLDIGANIGAFSISVGHHFPKVQIHAFEPAPANLLILKENVALNQLESQVRIHPVALSQENGFVTLSYEGSRPGDTTISKDTDGEQISSARLDQQLQNLPDNATVFIKIDVEGHEMQVLKGFGNALNGRTVYLLIEDMFHTEELYSVLRKMGFSFAGKWTSYNSWWQR